jgi:hypothetical protein
LPLNTTSSLMSDIRLFPCLEEVAEGDSYGLEARSTGVLRPLPPSLTQVFILKNPEKMWSRRPRLLLIRTAGGGCSTFYPLG